MLTWKENEGGIKYKEQEEDKEEAEADKEAEAVEETETVEEAAEVEADAEERARRSCSRNRSKRSRIFVPCSTWKPQLV